MALLPAGDHGKGMDVHSPAKWETLKHGHGRRRWSLLSTLLLSGCFLWLAGCAGCDEEEEPIEETPTAFALEKVDGDDQSAEVSEALLPMVVRVVDRDGRPVPDHTVHFAVGEAPPEATGQALDVSTVQTDEHGRASAVMTLGSWPGSYQVTATADGELGGSPAVFTATATAGVGPASAIEIVSGDNQSAKVREALTRALVVRLTDVFGNPVPGTMVRFQVEEFPPDATGQALSPILAPTGGNGQASSTLTLGSKPGEYQVSATVEGVAGLSERFFATAVVGDAHRIDPVSGDGSSARVTETLSQSFVVRVLDAFGNRVAGQAVTFAIAETPVGATGQTLSVTSVDTDQEGLAQTLLTLGTKAGAYRVEASAGSISGSPVVFGATAGFGDAVVIQEVSGSGQTGQVVQALFAPFVVRVADQHGNPVPGHEVLFAEVLAPGGATGQTLSASAVVTDAAGLASTLMTLGTRTGAYEVAASSAGGLLGSPIGFTATATSGSAFALVTVSGSGQSGPVATALPGALVVGVTDEYGNSVAGHGVNFAIEAVPEGGTGHSLSVSSVVTGADGTASTRLTLSRKVGSHRVSATAAGGLVGSPASFDAEAVAGPPAVFQPVSGSNQTAAVGEALPNPIIVHVMDAHWNPVPGHGVTFAITSAPVGATGHALSQTVVTTDSVGRAQTVLTLGTIVGSYPVRATADGGIYGSPVNFQVSAVHGPAFALQQVAGDGQSAVVTSTLPAAHVVRVADQYGNAVPGHAVDFSLVQVPAGATGQSLSAGSVTTNSDGLASTTLTLGQRSGTYDVGATAAGALSGSPALFSAEALVDAAFSLESVSGNEQVEVVTETLVESLTVRVRDVHGNVIAGHDIAFSITSTPADANGQVLSLASLPTDTEGLASTDLTLGTKIGAYQVVASAAGNLQGSPITFVATGIAAPAFQLLEVSGADQEMTVTGQLVDPFVVRVIDAYGNPIADHAIVFSIEQAPADSTGEALSVSTATTGPDGFASSLLTLGSKPGIYRVDVTAVGDLVGSPVTFFATAHQDAASELRYLGGGDQTATVTEPLPIALAVLVVDQHGNAVAGQAVHFAFEQLPSLSTGHSLSVTTAASDGNGIASTILTLGTRAGVYQVSAAAGALTGSPVLFSATALPKEPHSIEEVSGGDQTAVVAHALPEALVVRILDEHGNPLAGQAVTFALDSAPTGSMGQGLDVTLTTTDADGLARAHLTLGTKAGSYVVSATPALPLNGSPIVFFATALPGEAFLLERISGDGQSATVTTQLPQAFVFRVVDEYGNGVPGHQLTFVIDEAPPTATGQMLSTSSAATDESGLASTILTLGTRAGSYVTGAASGSGAALVPVSVTSTALADAPFALQTVSGADQTAVVTQTLPIPLSVRVVDAHGNPIMGHQIDFSIDQVPSGATGQTVSSAVTTTDAEGGAQTILTLGTKVGAYQVSAASAAGLLGSPALFTATALVDQPFALERVQGDGQTGIVLETLEPLVVRVVDQHGNAIAGYDVSFVLAGVPAGAIGQALSVASATTDPAGLASTVLTLGGKSGDYQVSASAGALQGSPLLFSCTALPDAAFALEEVGGGGQTQVVTLPLPDPFVVRVVDRHGNAVAGHPIQFAIDLVPAGAVGQSLSVAATATDTAGLATSLLTLGTKAGLYRVTAAAEASLSGSPAVFEATGEAAAPDRIEVELFPSSGIKPGELSDLVLTVVDPNGNPILGWSGRVDLTLETDVWGVAPAWIDIEAQGGAGHTAPASVSFSAADEAHFIRASSGLLQGLSTAIQVVPGELVGLRAEHSAFGESASGSIRVSFQLGSAWPPDGSMEIDFQAGHDLSLATLDWVEGADGAFVLTVLNGSTARIDRTGGSWLPAGSPIEVNLGQITNPAAGPEGPISVSTAIDDGRLVDVGVYLVSFWEVTASSGHHSCGIDAAGRLWCWGEGVGGKLGNGTTLNRLLPTEVAGGHTDWIDVAAGRDHTCALRAAAGGGATLWCWGNGGGGRLGDGATTTRPTPVEVFGGHTDWLAVSPGWQHTCGLRASGVGATLWCWGTGTSGRLGNGTTDAKNVPTEVFGAHTDWVEVAGGGAHTCGIRASGLAGAGTMWCWGEGTFGQLGHGANTQRLVPNEVPGEYDDWIRVSANERHTCGITSIGGSESGVLWCWGDGSQGRLGAGTTEHHFIPNAVFGGHGDWLQVSAGNFHTCGLRAQGAGAGLWCWGPGEWGRLGNGGYYNHLAPVEVGGDWMQVSSAIWHTCGLIPAGDTGRGMLQCWGNNIYGQLGLGLRWVTQHLRPVSLAVDRRITKISARLIHGCALAEDGSLWCWGAGANGRLASGDIFNRTTPIQVPPGLEDWIDVSAGEAHSCAIAGAVPGAGGRLWCWGAGGSGRLGNGDTIDSHQPVEVLGGFVDWLQVEAGGMHTCGIRNGGTGDRGSLWCWGAGGSGRLGDGTTANSSTPVQVSGAHLDWVRVVVGGAHTCGIRESGTGDRTLWCWGVDGSGQRGDGDAEATNNPVQVWGSHPDWVEVTAGSAHTCGIRAVGAGGQGRLWCWGAGGTGRLGDGSTADRSVPVEVFGEETDWIEISAGVAHTCGIRESSLGGQGYLWCWGSGDSGRLGTDATTMWTTPAEVFGGRADWLQVSAASLHTHGLRAGRGWSWGSNASVQIGDGTRFKGEPHIVLQ